MLQIERWKIVLVLLLTVLGIAYAVPNVLPPAMQAKLEASVPDWMPSRTINLGLDLRGGSHILLEADMHKVMDQHMKSLVGGARLQLRKQGVHYENLKATGNGISFRVWDEKKQATDPSELAAAKDIAQDLDRTADLAVGPDGTVTLTLDEKAINAFKSQVINESIEIVRRRVDETGTKEPVIQRQGSDRIVVQLPGVGDPKEIEERLGRTAQMSFHLLDEDALSTGQLGPGSLKLPVRGRGQEIVVHREAVLDGKNLTDAQPSFDQYGSPVVTFRFDSTGTKIFCDITHANVGKPFAIVMDNEKNQPEVLTDPVIHEPICGGSGQISGSFTPQETAELSLLLRAGALPAPLNVVEERTVGPTLGSDSIAAGKKAALYAFVFVFFLMGVSYGRFGIFANIALALNIVFIFAFLSMLQATLTLPGIAGIILTIGIAVDSNVLIYERIREEFRQGRSVLSSIDTGYRQALRTIFDSNLTTLIVALILFSFGSGPVKGFAVTMCIGIVTSLFASIMLTRLIIVTWLRRAKPTTLTL